MPMTMYDRRGSWKRTDFLVECGERGVEPQVANRSAQISTQWIRSHTHAHSHACIHKRAQASIYHLFKLLYMFSICKWKYLATSFRFTFIVGVNNPFSTVINSGWIWRAFTWNAKQDLQTNRKLLIVKW